MRGALLERIRDIRASEKVMHHQVLDLYAALTDLMSKTWSGMTTREYKRFKELKKENLRDNMTNTELVLNMPA